MRAPDFERAFAELLVARANARESCAETARAIVAQVRARGDAALIELSRRLDGAELAENTLRVGEEEIAEADAKCAPAALAALDLAASRIQSFHRRQLPKDERLADAAGAMTGWRWTPLDSVGLYAPGGIAAYPSSVLMSAIPAQVAGVARIAMVTPAPHGAVAPLVLAAARRAGVAEIYRIGGAQAIAALAYGTGTIAPVDKIVGPGNAYVAAAKREVFGDVGIDSIAGPSEVLVLSDARSDPDWIAADLLAQAEHDRQAQSILIADDAAFADAVETAVERALETLARKDIAGVSWRDFGAIILAESLAAAIPLVNRIAPEHLEIATDDPEVLLARVRHAGAVFLGRLTPEVVGDYVAGPNHVLPTSRAARFSSGLSVLDFMKRTTLLSCSANALEALGPTAIALAEAEGLEGHARSVAARLNRRLR
jgi:histidinol dehydrogenase